MIYSELQRHDDIRLLTILPASNVQLPLRTTLSTNSLLSSKGDDQKYVALSYVWGPPHSRKYIICNEQEISVTSNLHAALLQLRREDDNVVIWIDQLCINQADVAERNKQVSMMGQIYSSAERVHVWLGLSDEDTPVIWNLFVEANKFKDFDASEVYNYALGHRQGELPNINSLPMAAPHDSLSQTDPARLPNLPPSDHTCWQAVQRFFGRPWFCRMWTFQEVAMSTSGTVWCGAYYISWKMLHNACIGMEMAGYRRYAGIQQNITILEAHRERLHQGARSSLRPLLENNRMRDATDARDMVYALRGVIDTDSAHRIHIDYQAPLGVVYARAARFCIESEKSLTVLGSVEYRRTEESADEMPSWVPDWRYRTSVGVDLSMRRLDHSRYFDASNGEIPRLGVTSNERKRSLTGIIVAKLTKFYDLKTFLNFKHRMRAERFPPERFEHHTWTEMYKKAALSIHFPASSLEQLETADHITAAMWSTSINDHLTDDSAVEMAFRRTITADLLPRPKSRLNKEETIKSFPAFSAWQDAGFRAPVPLDVLQEHDYYVAKVMSNREFFVAENESRSYMGIVMGVPRDGDWVCLLLGGDTPFILRPRENGDWCFLAEAYVHGIMDGEAIRDAYQKGCEYQEFTLS